MTTAYDKFFINGEWIEPAGRETLEVINPATEEAVGTVSLGNHGDVDAAVAAAQEAFHSFSQTKFDLVVNVSVNSEVS